MRKFLTSLPLMLTLMLWAVPAKADLLSVHADIPFPLAPPKKARTVQTQFQALALVSVCLYSHLGLHMSLMKFPTQVTLLILKTPTKSLVCL